ncbi:unnamed protein product [Paramecium octaurelia]|uniref:Uncharacterized protein n=1 Tax=Paramecium octaurelia TaxID=43137 RepID=A0A8S1RZC0_PAROT|nr:unnamed protein product [Paramecium octaurelia]
MRVESNLRICSDSFVHFIHNQLPNSLVISLLSFFHNLTTSIICESYRASKKVQQLQNYQKPPNTEDLKTHQHFFEGKHFYLFNLLKFTSQFLGAKFYYTIISDQEIDIRLGQQQPGNVVETLSQP